MRGDVITGKLNDIGAGALFLCPPVPLVKISGMEYSLRRGKNAGEDAPGRGEAPTDPAGFGRKA